MPEPLIYIYNSCTGGPSNFSGLAPSKLKKCLTNLNVSYVHIECSTYQFSEESERGGEGNGNEKSVVLRGLNMFHVRCAFSLLLTRSVSHAYSLVFIWAYENVKKI